MAPQESAPILQNEHDSTNKPCVDPNMLDNICAVLSCARSEIKNIFPLEAGLTNRSFCFTVKNGQYVYRHPGAGTEEIINRDSEAFSQNIARELGIDDTFIYQDPQNGWKISHFVADCKELDYHNRDQVERALQLGRRLHKSGARSQWTFDVFQKAQEIIALLKDRPAYLQHSDFDALHSDINRLAAFVRSDNVPLCLCHNDFYAPNFLVKDGYMALIDWEYSAMSDYASDLGTFICCSDYNLEQAKDAITCYFGRAPSEKEMRHCLAYVAISGFYWFVWALYKESESDSVGDWLELWHRHAKDFSCVALELYEKQEK